MKPQPQSAALIISKVTLQSTLRLLCSEPSEEIFDKHKNVMATHTHTHTQLLLFGEQTRSDQIKPDQIRSNNGDGCNLDIVPLTGKVSHAVSHALIFFSWWCPPSAKGTVPAALNCAMMSLAALSVRPGTTRSLEWEYPAWGRAHEMLGNIPIAMVGRRWKPPESTATSGGTTQCAAVRQRLVFIQLIYLSVAITHSITHWEALLLLLGCFFFFFFSVLFICSFFLLACCLVLRFPPSTQSFSHIIHSITRHSNTF